MDGRNVKLPLTTLIEILEGEGFRIDIDLRLKLQKILFAFREEIPIGDFDKLKSYIRPVIAKSHNQQLVFDRAFEKYVRFIESRSEIIEEIDEGNKDWIKRTYRTPLLIAALTIPFLLLVYYWYSTRPAPNINLLVPVEWASVGDSLIIEGQVSGILVNASISLNDSILESRHFYSAENDIISHKIKFKDPDNYEVKLSAHNSLVSEETSQKIISIEVCESKPKINFLYEIDSLNPLKVTFKPKITNVSRDYSLSMRSNGNTIPLEQLIKLNDSTLIYEFSEPDTYDVELTVSYTTNSLEIICDHATAREVISLNSVILGDKMALKVADPNKGRIDSLNRIEKDADELVVGVISYKEGKGLMETYRPIFDSVIDKLDNYQGLDLKFIDGEKLSEALLQGNFDIGIYTVFPYLKSAQKNSELTVMATHQIAGKKDYDGYIITRASDGHNKLADLEGERFTFVKPTSTSGYKLPKGIFQMRGLAIPNKDFKDSISGSHEKSIALLIEGKTDAIAVDESRFQAAKDTLNTNDLHILHTYRVPYHAYVLSPQLTQDKKNLIKSVLIDSIRINTDNPLGIEKLLSVNDEYYNELRRHLNIARRKPGFVLDSIEIADEISAKNLKLHDTIKNSIEQQIKNSNRFVDKDSTQYIYKANLSLNYPKEGLVRYNIGLNNEFIGSGEIAINNVIDNLPKLFVHCILNALPIQSVLIRGKDQKNVFIPYGTTDGINPQDYVFTVSGDTIDSRDLTITDFDTYFTNLDQSSFKNSASVRITHPSPNTSITQYFNVFNTSSWAQITGGDTLQLILWLVVFLILPPVALELLYFRNRKVIPSSEITSSLQFEGIKAPYELELPNQDHNIRPEKELYLLARRLKHRREAGTSKMDVFKSIRNTAKNAGFIELFFRETTKIPEYLVIIDRSSAEGFHTQLFTYLNHFLQNEDTLLNIFYFSNNPRYLKNHKHPEGISLEALSEKYPDHTLLLFSDGNKLINNKLDRIFRWASEIIPKWGTRFLLTPNSPTEWDRGEDLINQYIPVFPATLKGMLFMTECLSEKQLPDFNKRKSALKLKGGNSFYSYDTVEGIKEFLNDPSLFQWFCALALYPKMHWQLVISIGKAIAEKYTSSNSNFNINYGSLFMICKVSHLLESDMDDDLRIELLKCLDPKAERIARRAILDLIQDLNIPHDSYIFREIMVQTKVNHSLLDQNNLQATKDLFYLWENNLIEDRATKSYLSGSTKNLWNKKAEDYFSTVDHKNWKRLLFRRGPLYLAASILILVLLNLSLFQKIIEPKKPEFAFNFKPIGTTSQKMVSYAAILNNQAVEIYKSDPPQVEKADSLLRLALSKDSIIEARRNMKIIRFNQAMNSYLARNFKSAKEILAGLLSDSDAEDTLHLASIHYLGLSDYYQNNLSGARRYLNQLKSKDSLFLNNYYPNLEVLLNGESFSICQKYSNYSKEEWRQNFLRETKDDTWNVFIAFLRGVTKEIAERRADDFRRANPGLDVNVISKVSASASRNSQYAIVLAEGLDSEVMAREIASFASGCGIAKEAYASRQSMVDRIPSIEKKESAGAFMGHSQPIRSLAFSPNGQQIISTSDDGTVRLWDRAGKLILELKGHTGPVYSVAISPDGRSILTGSMDNTARLWDQNGNLIAEVMVHNAPVNSVAFSPDGRTMLTGSGDGSLRLWELNGNLIQSFQGSTLAIFSVAFSPDGSFVLAGSGDDTARLWDLKGNLIREFKGHNAPIYSVAYSPIGQLILTGSGDKTARLWSLDGKMAREFTAHTQRIWSVAFSPDGSQVLTGSLDKTALLWGADGNIMGKFKTSNFSPAVFSPDGGRIAAGVENNSARLWNITKSSPNSKLRSVASKTPSKLTVRNSTSDKIECYWINYEGIEIFYGVVEAGQDWVLDTFVSHPWVFKQAGQVRSTFTATDATHRFIEMGTYQSTPDNIPTGVVNGRNVKRVVYEWADKKLGYFENKGSKKWVEGSLKGKERFLFEEIQRDDWSVYLYDASRQVSIQLDLHRKEIFYSDPKTTKRVQYNISSVE